MHIFCIGNNVASNSELLREIDKRGHLIGNHSWSHERWFDLYPSEKMKEEIEKTNKAIFETIGKKTRLFRPPYGVTNPSLKKALKSFDFYNIGWNIRSFDTINDRTVMEYKAPKQDVDIESGKGTKEAAEYDEYRVEFDMDGTPADGDVISENIKKEIIEEASEIPEQKIKRAGGGVAYMLGE